MAYSIAPAHIAAPAAAAAPAIAGPGLGARAAALVTGLLARYGAWLQRLEDAQRLNEMEPRIARDMGMRAGADRCPPGCAVDPRPLWGIGQTPSMGEVLPPWHGSR